MFHIQTKYTIFVTNYGWVYSDRQETDLPYIQIKEIETY